ncbi:MAG: hypothetical protein HY924_08680 [Elusimicrobia bacterium]|nr:hypothetical protein [Elusimicrobiota bacterium]
MEGIIALIVALALGGVAAVVVLHLRQRGDPVAAAAWRAAHRWAFWVALLVGAAVYAVFLRSMPTDHTPGNAMLLMGGVVAGPMAAFLAWGISLPVLYAWLLSPGRAAGAEATAPAGPGVPQAGAKPGPRAWNPYWPGLVFLALAWVKTSPMSNPHHHPKAWAAFYLCVGVSALLAAFARERGLKLHWAGIAAAGVLAGGVSYAWVRGMGPVGLMRRRAWEAQTQASLARVRGQIAAYARTHEGRYPKSLINDDEMRSLLAGPLPQARLGPLHLDTGLLNELGAASLFSSPHGDYYGGWAYDPPSGRFFVACDHTDSRGTVWSSY